MAGRLPGEDVDLIRQQRSDVVTPMMELVDITDLKSVAQAWGFESLSGYQ